MSLELGRFISISFSFCLNLYPPSSPLAVHAAVGPPFEYLCGWGFSCFYLGLFSLLLVLRGGHN